MAKETTEHYFCRPNGVFTLEELFNKNIAKTLVRRVDRGHAEFSLYGRYNPRWDTGAGWKLTKPKLVIEAIRLGKKNDIIFYGGSK